MFKSNIDKKMKQKIVDLGKYTVATKWDDITLKKWSDYIRLTSEQKDKDNGIDIITTLEIKGLIVSNGGNEYVKTAKK